VVVVKKKGALVDLSGGQKKGGLPPETDPLSTRRGCPLKKPGKLYDHARGVRMGSKKKIKKKCEGFTRKTPGLGGNNWSFVKLKMVKKTFGRSAKKNLKKTKPWVGGGGGVGHKNFKGVLRGSKNLGTGGPRSVGGTSKGNYPQGLDANGESQLENKGKSGKGGVGFRRSDGALP